MPYQSNSFSKKSLRLEYCLKRLFLKENLQSNSTFFSTDKLFAFVLKICINTSFLNPHLRKNKY